MNNLRIKKTKNKKTLRRRFMFRNARSVTLIAVTLTTFHLLSILPAGVNRPDFFSLHLPPNRARALWINHAGGRPYITTEVGGPMASEALGGMHMMPPPPPTFRAPSRESVLSLQSRGSRTSASAAMSTEEDLSFMDAEVKQIV